MVEKMYHIVVLCLLVGIYKTAIDLNQERTANNIELGKLDSAIQSNAIVIQRLDSALSGANAKIDSLTRIKPAKNAFNQISRDSAINIIQRNIERKNRKQ